MQKQVLTLAQLVHCRIGSLEIFAIDSDKVINVHCRIGSLEKNSPLVALDHSVHCRIGSLEIS